MDLLEILKHLTTLDGVSGNEKPVRDFILSHVKDYVDEYHIDNVGNLITYKKGKGKGPKVMLSAHMDEVGLLISHINSDGLLKFQNVGGIEPRVLVGKRVRIGEKGIPGVIGFKPIHLQSSSERNGSVTKKQLLLDIGAKDRDQAEEYVEVGDIAAFAYEPVEFGDNKLMAKALDDRTGCAVLMELLKGSYECDVYGCFTVQEEVGLKGAKTAAFKVMPDVALVLEGTTCYDVSGAEEHLMCTWLGKGPALTVMDRQAIIDRDLLSFITQVGNAAKIPYQFKKTISGGTDAGRIQVNGTGVRVAVMAVPCRYIHTPVSVMDISDFENMLKLAKAVLKELPNFQSGKIPLGYAEGPAPIFLDHQEGGK
ncbi:MAG: M42 family metallopeptidase [Clostridia bacterium]|nr:M42 family metallopeptidase [Clostridia bacterium]